MENQYDITDIVSGGESIGPMFNYREASVMNYEIDEMCREGGQKVRSALQDLSYALKFGFGFIPVCLFKHRKLFQEHYIKGKSDVMSIAYLMSKFNFCSIDSFDIRVIDFRVPYKYDVSVMSRNIFENLVLNTRDGIISLFNGTHPEVVDYILPKYDGIRFASMLVETKGDTYSYAFFGARVVKMISSLVVSGELIDNDLYLYDGNVFVTAQKLDNILLEDRVIGVHVVEPITIEAFLSNTDMPLCDGYIFGISGREYKLKKSYTYDFKVWDGILEVDNLSVKVKNPIPGYRGICEFKYDGQYMHCVKERNDKTVSQTKRDFDEIKAAITYDVMCGVLSPFKRLFISPLLEYYPLAYLMRVIEDYYATNQNRMCTRFIIQKILLSRKMMVSGEQVEDIYRAMGGEGTKCFFVKGTYHPLKSDTIKYLSRYEIFFNMKRHGISGSLHDVAKWLADITGKVVSLQKLKIMVIRDELCAINGMVNVKQCGGEIMHYKVKIIERELITVTVDTAVHGLIEYNKNNKGPNLALIEYEAFKSECNELMAVVKDQAVLEEVGDVLMMFAKVIIHQYTSGAPLCDEASYIWGMFASADIMQPFIEKMNRRIAEFGCVRNHLTCSDHVCSSGKLFQRDKKGK